MTTILLCEDDSDVSNVLSRMLRLEGYEVVATTNAAVALQQALGPNPPDLLITDLMMPGAMNGADLVATLEVAIPALPILAITGNIESTARTRRVGQNSTLLYKPFSRQEFVGHVETMLANVI